MSRDGEWFGLQSECNKQVHERLRAARPDRTYWGATVLFHSALHRVDCWFCMQTGSVPKSRAEGNPSQERAACVIDDCSSPA